MEQANWKSGSADALLAEFFAQDDLKALAADAGAFMLWHITGRSALPIRFFRMP